MAVILDYFGQVGPEWMIHNYRNSVEIHKIILVCGDIKEMVRKYCGA